MTLPVRVRCGRHEVLTYAMLDSGSQRTFCQSALARKLKARGPRQSVPMYTLSTGSKVDITDSMAISLTICEIDEDQPVELDEVLTVHHIPLKAASIPSDVELKHMKHLQSVTLLELKDKSVGLLIGLDASTVFRAIANYMAQKELQMRLKLFLDGRSSILHQTFQKLTEKKGLACTLLVLT